MTHDCKQEENIGMIKEFIISMKGFKTLFGTVVLAIVIQVGTFLFLWGGLIETVNKNTDQVWNKNTPCITENTRNIDKILAKLETANAFRTREVRAESVK
jgi:hypothetical protein